MSQQDLDRFISDLQRDPELLQEFRRLSSDMDAAVRWVNSRGYAFTRDEAERMDADGELSDEDLDQVAGGWTSSDPPPQGSGTTGGTGG
jgi:predicted ribosomally synthesized peptide with nif11-like leader